MRKFIDSPICAAIFTKNIEVVKLLLAKYKVNLHYDGLPTALMATINWTEPRNGEETIIYLLENGALLNTLGDGYNKVLSKVARHRSSKIIEIFLKHLQKDVAIALSDVSYGKFIANTLRRDTSNDEIDSVVELIIRHGANINTKNLNYGTSLMFGVYNRIL